MPTIGEGGLIPPISGQSPGKHDDQLDALSQFLMRADVLLKKAGHDPPEKYSPNLLKVNVYGFNPF